MKNEILEEVWEAREEFSRKHNYDIKMMVAALQEAEKHPLSKVVDKTKKLPNESLLNTDIKDT